MSSIYLNKIITQFPSKSVKQSYPSYRGQILPAELNFHFALVDNLPIQV